MLLLCSTAASCSYSSSPLNKITLQPLRKVRQVFQGLERGFQGCYFRVQMRCVLPNNLPIC